MKVFKMNNSNAAEEQAMFEKESKEHPEFSEEQIWEIVKDHLKKENANPPGKFYCDECRKWLPLSEMKTSKGDENFCKDCVKREKVKGLFDSKQNAQDWPSTYTCNFLEQGLVSYKDVGAGVALLKKETIDKVLNSIVGKPVLIDHQNATKENFKEMAVGYVTAARFNASTGWFDCDFLLTDDEAKRLCSRGYSVSCAFDVVDTMKGGEWHAMKYDEEISNLQFTHLALVANPRYEECRVLANSKEATIKENAEKCPKCGSTNMVQGKTLDICKDCDANIQHPSDKGYSDAKENDYASFNKGDDVLFTGPNGQDTGKIEYTDLNGDKSVVQIRSNTDHNLYSISLSQIRVKKQQSKEKVNMFNLFKKKENKGKELDITKAYASVDGEKIPIADLIKHKNESDEALKKSEEEKANEVGSDDEIEHDGIRHRVSDLVKGWKSSKLGMASTAKKVSDKKNEKETEEEAKREEEEGEVKNGTTEKGDPLPKDADKVNEKEEEKKEEEKKENETSEETKDKEEKETIKKEGKEETHEAAKTNSKEEPKRDLNYFKALNSAKEKAIEEHTVLHQSLNQKTQRGDDRYGSKKK